MVEQLMGIRDTKREVIIGVESGIVDRIDLFLRERIISQNRDAGNPVPVVFGMRWIEPVVSGWKLGDVESIRRQLDTVKFVTPTVNASFNPEDPTQAYRTIRVPTPPNLLFDGIQRLFLTTRMIVCVGVLDDTTEIVATADGANFVLEQKPVLPANTEVFNAMPDDHEKVTSWASSGYTRYEPNYLAIGLFGDAGGLGMEYGRGDRRDIIYFREGDAESDPKVKHGFRKDSWSRAGLYDKMSKCSAVWLSDGTKGAGVYPSDPDIDQGIYYMGVTSLFFDAFQFGGKSPPARWRIAVSRTNTLSERTTTDTYPAQWYPEKARITELVADRGSVDGSTSIDINESDDPLIDTSLVDFDPVPVVLGHTINPIHVLREILTNRDWGAGIPASWLDDALFRQAADVCHAEQLDYCYAYNRQTGDGVQEITQSLLEYIDGFLSFDTPTNRVRLKLIRDDYDIDEIPSFDESSIAKITGYSRQHGDRPVNSLVVKYHDAQAGVDETFALHNIESAILTGVKTYDVNYPGCPTLEAANRIAHRELFTVNQPVVSFRAYINPGSTVIRLGDPLLISFQDLAIQRIVMRVIQVSFPDGLDGGLWVDLVQDVFSLGNQFGDVVKPVQETVASLRTTPKQKPPLLFVEANSTDVTDRTIGAKFLKVGRRYDPNNTGTITTAGGTAIAVSVGELLTLIPTLVASPVTVSHLIRIRINVAPTASSLIRVGDEIMRIGATVTEVETDIYEVEIVSRGELDSVPSIFPLAKGSDVLLLDKMYVPPSRQTTEEFRSSVRTYIPRVRYAGRRYLPPCPRYASVNGIFNTDFVHKITGTLTVKFLARAPSPAVTEIWVVRPDGASVYRQDYAHSSSEQTATLTASNLGNTDKSILISVRSYQNGDRWGKGFGNTWAGGKQSWKAHNFFVKWEATVDQTGYGNDWGNGWAGSSDNGWDNDWDQDFGE